MCSLESHISARTLRDIIEFACMQDLIQLEIQVFCECCYCLHVHGRFESAYQIISLQISISYSLSKISNALPSSSTLERSFNLS